MHEFALAEAVVETAVEEADREGLRDIRRIEVRVGELQRIDREAFGWALREVIPASAPRLATARIDVQVDPARFRCRPCGREFGLVEAGGPTDEREREAIHFLPELAHAFLCCPACRSPDFEVRQGRGVTIDTIEGD